MTSSYLTFSNLYFEIRRLSERRVECICFEDDMKIYENQRPVSFL